MNAMKKLRPIEMPKPQDPYRKAQNGLLRHFALSEAEFRALERERPRHLVVEGDSVLACSAHDGLTFRLSYAYPDRDAFARLFPRCSSVCSRQTSSNRTRRWGFASR